METRKRNAKIKIVMHQFRNVFARHFNRVMDEVNRMIDKGKEKEEINKYLTDHTGILEDAVMLSLLGAINVAGALFEEKKTGINYKINILNKIKKSLEDAIMCEKIMWKIEDVEMRIKEKNNMTRTRT